MPHQNSIAVLIVAYRAADLLDECLRSVQRYLPGHEVYVWDNSGADCDGVRKLARRYGDCHWFFSEQNIGFAAAVNQLAKIVPDCNLLLLNPDAVLLSSLRRTFAELERPNVAAVGPLACTAASETHNSRQSSNRSSRRHEWDVAYRRLTLLNALGGAAGFSDRYRQSPLSFRYRRQPYVVDGFIAGGCLAICNDAWKQIGPFNEEFFLYQEEAEWQRRAIRSGWRVLLADELGVRHAGRGTVIGDQARSQRSEDLATANAALMLELSHGRWIADLYLTFWYLVDGLRFRIRRRRTSMSGPDVLLTANGSEEAMRKVTEIALTLEKSGYSVSVRSLQRLGSLPRDLPATIRLSRNPWWMPFLYPERRPDLVVTGATWKERFFAQILCLRKPTRVLSVGDYERRLLLPLAGPSKPLVEKRGSTS